MVACHQPLWYRFLSLALACAPASCGSLVDSLAHDERPIPNEVDQPPVVRDAVVPALLPLVDEATGLFRFPTPNVASGEMPLDTALVQAAEYLFYALNISVLRGSVEGQRGAFIDLPTLVACSRPQLARSVYESPLDSVPAVLRLQLGSSWRIPFCGSRRTPEVIVSVATLANGSRYKNSQSLGDTANSSVAFRVTGIPWEWRVEYVTTPEEAVNEVHAVTGARATGLPDFVRASQINGRGAESVWCPVWRVRLERAVRMAAVFSLRRLDLTEVYVGDSACPALLGRTVLLTPLPEQPTTREFVAFVRDPANPAVTQRVVYQARYRAPVNFETVIIER